jgi:hypothetical protein
LNKLLVGTLLALVCVSSYADDLKVADDFKSGDLVSADTFNQIFDTIEKINRTVQDSDLVGVWSCTGISPRTDPEWGTNKGIFNVVENALVNFTASSSGSSVEEAYTISTGVPNPFLIRQSFAPFTDAFTASYVVYNNNLITKHSAEFRSRVWEVNLISQNRLELIFMDNPAYSNSEYAPVIICDSAEAVPASPTAPTATNNKTVINLAWTDSSSDETGFKVYRKLSTETEAKVIATQTAVTYSDTDLTEGQTAYYHVTAYNDNGDSAKSKAVSATLDSIAPTVVSTSPANGEQVAVTDGILSITFSEKVKVICDGDPSITAGDCFTLSAVVVRGSESGAYYATYGKAREYANIATVEESFSVISGDLGPGLLSDSDTITVSIDKDWFRDMNGNFMEADFVFTFTTP